MQRKASQGDFLAFFDEIDEPVYVADPETHELLYANEKLKRIFGKDIIGKKCHSALQNLDDPCSFCTNKYIFGKNLGKTYIWDFKNRRNGRWYHCIDRAIRWQDGRYVRLEIAIDVTDWRRFEERLAVLHKYSQRLYMAKKVEEIYELTLDALKETLGVQYANFLVLDGKELKIIAQYGCPESLGQIIPLHGKKGLTARAARTGRPVLVADVTKDPAYIKTVSGIRSELAVPMKIGKTILGVLNVESKRPNAFDAKDVELLEILASHTAIAMMSLERQFKAEKRWKQLATLMKASAEIVQVKDLRKRLRAIVKAAKSLGWRRVVISERDENLEPVGDFVTIGLTKEDKKLLWERRAPGHVWRERFGPKFQRYRIGKFFHLPWLDPWIRQHVHGVPPDVPPEKAEFGAGVPSKLSPDEMIDWHPQDMLYAPLRTPDGKIVGMISLDDPVDGRKPTHETLIPLEIFLNLAAVAIENARLIQELEKARKALREYAEKLEQKVEERTRELKESQEKLLKAERLAAIGQLAGQVGHDLRNPLTGIKGAVYYLRKKDCWKQDENSRKMLDIIEKDIEYANKIITDLLEFSRGKYLLNPTSTTVRDLVEESLSRVKVPSNIKVINRTSFKHKVSVDPHYMKRVFLNLITNAFEAMPNGGTLKIWSQAASESVKVYFSDTGVGIPKENLEKIWGPLFTTKSKGMGLGLSICKRIVEAHGGTISVKSKLGAGTTFTITLPLKPKTENGGEKFWMIQPESSLSTTTKA